MTNALSLTLTYKTVREDEDFVLVIDDDTLAERQMHVIECKGMSAHELANRLLELPDNTVNGTYMSIVNQIAKGWDDEDRAAIAQQKELS